MTETSVLALARAFCDSSSHAHLMPPDDQRPCDYHRGRATAVLTLLRARAWDLGLVLPDEPPRPKPTRAERDAEFSRLNAENLRRRSAPITP